MSSLVTHTHEHMPSFTLPTAMYGPHPFQRESSFAFLYRQCWDFWGYTGEDYACKLGLQLQAVSNMVKRLAGSFE